MHSQHFDPTVYNNSLYGTVAGYDPSALKLQHSGYASELDANCYSNYVSSSNSQILQGYGGRDPPSYSDTTSFFHPGFVSGFGNTAGYYKSPTNVPVDISEYNQSMALSRTPESFLLKPPDSGAIASLSDGYHCNGGNAVVSSNSPVNSNNINSSNNSNHTNNHILSSNAGASGANNSMADPQHHLNHRHHSLHHSPLHNDHLHLPVAYGSDVASNGMTPNKIDDSNSFFGPPHAIKLEPATSSQLEVEKTEAPALSSCSVTSHKSPHNTSNVDNSTTHAPSSSPCKTSHNSNLLQDDPNSNGSPGNTKPITGGDEKNGDKVNEEKKEDGDGKPTMSYIALIAKAILESDQRRLNLGSIYGWIEKHYPFYKNKGQGWRNSVRHNLSLNDCFIKAGRCEDGKGNYWAIHPANIQDFMRGDFRQRRRSRRRGRKKECELSVYNTMTNGYLPPSGAALTPGMTLNPAALSSIYSPYTEAERRAYRLDEALLRQSMNNPFVKWYQHGVATPPFCPSSSPSPCTPGVYSNTPSMQWTQGYGDGNPAQSMYQTINPSFPRHYPSTPVL